RLRSVLREDTDAMAAAAPDDIGELDGALVAANDRFGPEVVGEGADQDDGEALWVVEAHIEGIGHFAAVVVVLKDPAGGSDQAWEGQAEHADRGCEYVWEEVGAWAAGVIEEHAPAEEAFDGERHLGRVSEEAFPVEVGSWLRVRIGNRHTLAPVAVAVEAGLNKLGFTYGAGLDDL